MASEEAIIRLGLDARSVHSSLAGVKGAFEEFKEGTARRFIHAQGAAHAFRESMSTITDKAPLLGIAIKAALSPVGGMLAIAIATFEFFNDKIKEGTESFKRMGDSARQPIGDIKANLRQGRNELEEFNREFEKWSKAREKSPSDKITEHLSKELELLHGIAEAAKQAHPGVGNRVDRTVLQTQSTLQQEALAKLNAEKAKVSVELSAAKLAAQEKAKSPLLRSAEESNKAELERQAMLKEEIERKKNAATSSGEVIMDALGNMGTGRSANAAGEAAAEEKIREINQLSDEVKFSKKRMEKNNEVIDKETKVRAEIKDKLELSKSKYEKLTSASETLTQSLESTKIQLKTMATNAAVVSKPQRDFENALADQTKFTLAELAASGQEKLDATARFNQGRSHKASADLTPAEQDAMQVQQMESQARRMAMNGDQAGAQDMLRRTDRIKEGMSGMLKDSEAHPFKSMVESLTNQDKSMAELLSLAKAEGIRIIPKMGE